MQGEGYVKRVRVNQRHSRFMSNNWKKPHYIATEQPKKKTVAQQKDSIRLYDLPRDAGVTVRYADIVLEFGHIDGMYSYNTIKEGKSKGQVFHLSASAPLRKISEKEYEVLI